MTYHQQAHLRILSNDSVYDIAYSSTPSSTLFAAAESFISRSFATTEATFSRAASLSSYAWMAFSIKDTSRILPRGTTLKTFR